MWKTAISVLLLISGPLLSACSHVNGAIGNLLADNLPQWAGGEPKGIPPRPGTPGYEEFRNRMNSPRQDPSGSADKAPGAVTEPADPGASPREQATPAGVY
jgi:hypothetical protein